MCLTYPYTAWIQDPSGGSGSNSGYRQRWRHRSRHSTLHQPVAHPRYVSTSTTRSAACSHHLDCDSTQATCHSVVKPDLDMTRPPCITCYVDLHLIQACSDVCMHNSPSRKAGCNTRDRRALCCCHRGYRPFVWIFPRPTKDKGRFIRVRWDRKTGDIGQLWSKILTKVTKNMVTNSSKVSGIVFGSLVGSM